eukprot:s1263_g16.t1
MEALEVSPRYTTKFASSSNSVLGAAGCDAPFLAYHPFPMAPLTACKYCAVASLMNLQEGDELFELGGGCGIGAAWLATSFGVKVTMVDLMQQHVDGAKKLADEVGIEMTLRQGDVAELDAYPDESFDVLIENGAMTFLGSAAAMCTIFRRHLLRMLRPQGVMWVGGLNNPFLPELYVIGAERWAQCFQPFKDEQILSYVLFSEMQTFGVAESWDDRELSMLLKKKTSTSPASSPGEIIESGTNDAIRMYGCKADISLLPVPSLALEVLETELPEVKWRDFLRSSFTPGASFWLCAKERLKRMSLATRVGNLWTILDFVADLETRHLEHFFDTKVEPRSNQFDKEQWVDEMIVPTGVDAVLDDLELRLEEEVGLPASHSDPWHILRYEPGYRAHFEHTDCEAEDLVPNDRYITVLIWLSDCWNSTIPCHPFNASGAGRVDGDFADGATVFPHYGLHMRMPRGGLVLYNSLSEGRCDKSSEHFAASLDAAAPAKLVLTKWFYVSPTEPNMPKVPASVCNGDPPAQCKHFFTPAEGMGAQRVQQAVAQLQWRVGELGELVGDDLEQVQAMMSSSEVQELRDALEHQVGGSSLGQSPHWYSMMVLSKAEILALQFGAALDPLPRLRSAMKRCKGCVEVAESMLTGLLVSFAEGTSDRFDEALPALKRLALMDAAKAAELAREVVQMRLLQEEREREGKQEKRNDAAPSEIS